MREQRPHFRWKNYRLCFCIGGTIIATWPETYSARQIADRKTDSVARKLSDIEFIGNVRRIGGKLPTSQADIRRLVQLLRSALLIVEQGPRVRSAYRQRVRLEDWLAGKPIRRRMPKAPLWVDGRV
jgi:hypothetical protein